VEVRTAITYATLINVVSVVPVFFLQGLSGAFFKPLVLSYGLAVLVSMIVALSVTPALCLLLLSRGHRHQESPLLRVLKRGYGVVLGRIIGTPRPAMATAAVCLLAGVIVTPSLGENLLPNFKERDFLMHWLTKPGTSRGEEWRISVRACKDLREIPGVRNCGSHIGQAFLADEVYGVDFGENWISVSPKVDYDKTLASVQKTVDSYPGLYRDVQTYLRERVKEVLTGTSEAIVVRIYGPDLEVLRSKADETRSRRVSHPSTASSTHTPTSRRTSHTWRSRWTPTRRNATASSLAMYAGRRPHWSRAKRWVTSSGTARRTTCTSGARPRLATASPACASSRSTRPAAIRFIWSRWLTFV
jgi:Cu/Ag efflux pump CusA